MSYSDPKNKSTTPSQPQPKLTAITDTSGEGSDSQGNDSGSESAEVHVELRGTYNTPTRSRDAGRGGARMQEQEYGGFDGEGEDSEPVLEEDFDITPYLPTSSSDKPTSGSPLPRTPSGKDVPLVQEWGGARTPSSRGKRVSFDESSPQKRPPVSTTSPRASIRALQEGGANFGATRQFWQHLVNQSQLSTDRQMPVPKEDTPPRSKSVSRRGKPRPIPKEEPNPAFGFGNSEDKSQAQPRSRQDEADRLQGILNRSVPTSDIKNLIPQNTVNPALAVTTGDALPLSGSLMQASSASAAGAAEGHSTTSPLTAAVTAAQTEQHGSSRHTADSETIVASLRRSQSFSVGQSPGQTTETAKVSTAQRGAVVTVTHHEESKSPLTTSTPNPAFGRQRQMLGDMGRTKSSPHLNQTDNQLSPLGQAIQASHLVGAITRSRQEESPKADEAHNPYHRSRSMTPLRRRGQVQEESDGTFLTSPRQPRVTSPSGQFVSIGSPDKETQGVFPEPTSSRNITPPPALPPTDQGEDNSAESDNLVPVTKRNPRARSLSCFPFGQRKQHEIAVEVLAGTWTGNPLNNQSGDEMKKGEVKTESKGNDGEPTDDRPPLTRPRGSRGLREPVPPVEHNPETAKTAETAARTTSRRTFLQRVFCLKLRNGSDNTTKPIMSTLNPTHGKAQKQYGANGQTPVREANVADSDVKAPLLNRPTQPSPQTPSSPQSRAPNYFHNKSKCQVASRLVPSHLAAMTLGGGLTALTTWLVTRTEDSTGPALPQAFQNITLSAPAQMKFPTSQFRLLGGASAKVSCITSSGASYPGACKVSGVYAEVLDWMSKQVTNTTFGPLTLSGGQAATYCDQSTHLSFECSFPGDGVDQTGLNKFFKELTMGNITPTPHLSGRAYKMQLTVFGHHPQFDKEGLATASIDNRVFFQGTQRALSSETLMDASPYERISQPSTTETSTWSVIMSGIRFVGFQVTGSLLGATPARYALGKLVQTLGHYPPAIIGRIINASFQSLASAAVPAAAFLMLGQQAALEGMALESSLALSLVATMASREAIAYLMQEPLQRLDQWMSNMGLPKLVRQTITGSLSLIAPVILLETLGASISNLLPESLADVSLLQPITGLSMGEQAMAASVANGLAALRQPLPWLEVKKASEEKKDSGAIASLLEEEALQEEPAL